MAVGASVSPAGSGRVALAPDSVNAGPDRLATVILISKDLVYRRAEDVTSTPEPRAPCTTSTGHRQRPWRLTVRPDAALLFGFSALTANTHRIHYDRTYANQVEHHQGLVVHGPLIAMLMLELPRRHTHEQVTEIQSQARRPV